IPPVDRGGRPHARIMCEIGGSQSCDDLKAKCERWMRQEYVRCILGIKIYRKHVTRTATRQFDRCMIAMLWSRQAVPTHRQVAVAGQPGVFVEE
ncbi:3325_t:CDS:2, partial [Paraglomus brasilianum]